MKDNMNLEELNLNDKQLEIITKQIDTLETEIRLSRICFFCSGIGVSALTIAILKSCNII